MTSDKYSFNPMTSYQSDLSRHRLSVIESFRANDFGPLSYHEPNANHAKNFLFSAYSMAKTTKIISLYQFHDGDQNDVGSQYFRLRGGDDDDDLNELFEKHSAIVKISPGFILFVGKAASGLTLSNGATRIIRFTQVFIPDIYLTSLVNASLVVDFAERLRLVYGEAMRAQSRFVRLYYQEARLRDRQFVDDYDSFANVKRLLKCGNELIRTPEALRRVLEIVDEETVGQEVDAIFLRAHDYPHGSYLIHRDNVRLPSGRQMRMRLSVRVNYKETSMRRVEHGLCKTYTYAITFKWWHQ